MDPGGWMCEQLSSVHKLQHRITVMCLEFLWMFGCAIGQKQKNDFENIYFRSMAHHHILKCFPKLINSYSYSSAKLEFTHFMCCVDSMNYSSQNNWRWIVRTWRWKIEYNSRYRGRRTSYINWFCLFLNERRVCIWRENTEYRMENTVSDIRNQ